MPNTLCLFIFYNIYLVLLLIFKDVIFNNYIQWNSTKLLKPRYIIFVSISEERNERHYYHQRLITDSLCYHYPLSNKLYNYDVLSYTLNIEEKKEDRLCLLTSINIVQLTKRVLPYKIKSFVLMWPDICWMATSTNNQS